MLFRSADDIHSLSTTAATTSSAIGAAATALTEQDGRNALKFENGVATLSAQNLAVRRAFLAADEALERAQQAETDARIASYQVAADRMDADTASLASKDAKLQEVLLATIARLDALERTQRTDVSALTAADLADQTALNALAKASQNADVALEKATASLAEKHRKENLALVAADTALAKADKAAADAHASTHQALKQADEALAQKLADLKAHHDAEVAALRMQDAKLTAEDSLVAGRTTNLGLAMEAADALLRALLRPGDCLVLPRLGYFAIRKHAAAHAAHIDVEVEEYADLAELEAATAATTSRSRRRRPRAASGCSCSPSSVASASVSPAAAYWGQRPPHRASSLPSSRPII